MTQRVGRHPRHEQMHQIDRTAELLVDRVALGVELAAAQKRGQLRIRLAANPLSRVEIELLVETLSRNLGNGRAAFDDQPPVLLEVFGLGQATGHADDCQRDVGMVGGQGHANNSGR